MCMYLFLSFNIMNTSVLKDSKNTCTSNEYSFYLTFVFIHVHFSNIRDMFEFVLYKCLVYFASLLYACYTYETAR